MTGQVGHYCEKIAPGCKFCYSSNMQKRFGTPAFGGGQLRKDYQLFIDHAKLGEVLGRKKPTRYFWCDMTDFFGDWMWPEWFTSCFRTMDATPQHTHLLLTKRPENIRKAWTDRKCERCSDGQIGQPIDVPQKQLWNVPHVCGQCGGDGRATYRPNVWIGTSVSDQATADAMIPHLYECHDLSPVRFLSIEPLLGPVNLLADPRWFWAGTGIKWVIVGGESGHNARPCDVDWIRSIRDQCQAAGVPVFVKQLGTACRSNLKIELSATYAYSGKPADSKGGDMNEWPEDLRIRQFPQPMVTA